MLLKVPVKAEVYYFLKSELGNKPVVVSGYAKQHVVVDKVYDLLTRPDRFQEYDLSADYSHHIEFEICERTLKICSFDISQEKVTRFNQFVMQLMEERLFTLLDALAISGSENRPKVRIAKVIFQYMESYGLQNADVTYERLKKSYYRYRMTRQDRLVPKIVASVA